MVKTTTVPETALETILSLVEDGKGPTEIARALNKAGITRRGGKSFQRFHVRTILEGSRKTPGPLPPKGESLSKTPPKTPELLSVETEPVRQGEWIPQKLDIDRRRLALPGAEPGVTTQTKREAQILRIEQLIDDTAEDYKEAGTTDEKAQALQRLLRLLRLFDTTLASAEKAEATHSKVAHAIFLIGHSRGPDPEATAQLPVPGDDPLPSIFTQEAKAYMEELGGDWETFLDRLKGEE